jgi:uncharacterized RDD family membrane protein YckC
MTEPVSPADRPVVGTYAYAPPYIPTQYSPAGLVYPPRPVPTAPNGLPLADVGTRFVAYLIDTLILFVANLIPFIAVLALMFDRFRAALNDLRLATEPATQVGQPVHNGPQLWQLFTLELIALAIALPITLLFSYLYYVEFAYRNGRTVGKKIMKITVVRRTGAEPLTRRVMRRRWLVSHVASLFAPYFSYADALWLLWDKPFQQCLHDKCAETVVVKSRP